MNQGVPGLSRSNLEVEIDKINVVPTEKPDEAEIDEINVVPTEEIDEVNVSTEEMMFNKKCRGNKSRSKQIDSTKLVTETITIMPGAAGYGLASSDLNTIDDPNRPQTKVLLITAHRSGSTFLGELFNQNEKAFYLFEPLVAIQSKMSTMGCDENSERKIK